MSAAQIKAQFAAALQALAGGQLDRAETALKGLLLPTGGAAEVHFHLSRVAEARGDTPAQAKALERALAKAPEQQALLDAAQVVFARLDARDKALDIHDRLVALDPQAIKPKADKAHYLQLIGRFDEAEALLRALIEDHPNEPELYRLLVSGTKLAQGDPLIAAMKRLAAHPRLNDAGKMHLGFALAKLAEEQGKPEDVFAILDKANAMQSRLAPFDRAARDAEWDAFLAAQEVADYAPVGARTPVTPIFVVGMPRAGTTLVEQILGAHSAVTAAGETGHALREAVRQFGPADRMTPLADIPPAKLTRWGEGYLRLIRRDTGVTEGVVTDKSMQTQLIFGLIARAMPDARIIVVHRDPRDTALSIYRNHFRLGTHRYASDLEEIAHTIKRFRATVVHWKTRLGDRMTEIRYEDLVADPDGQSRQLVDAAGLDWEDACLRFHERGGVVKTLSLVQARQPVHAGRLQAWRRYEKDMAPFLRAWGDGPWD